MISIITPVYKAEKYISQTVEMVRKQTYADWELILVDDCSPDKSAEIVEGIIQDTGDTRIKLIRKAENAGAALARNTGIDAAVGRYIAFLDADDIWKPEKLEREIQFMNENDAGFVFCSYEFGDENGNPTGKAVRVPNTLDYKHALSRTVIFTTTVLIDTQKVDKKLIHMPNVGSEDTATWWQILKTGIIAYGLDEKLAIYRRPEKSLSSNKGKAITRIWNLYREVEGLNPIYSLICLTGWAFRATLRRVLRDSAS